MIYIYKLLCYCFSLFFFYKMVIVLLDIFLCGFEKNYYFYLMVFIGNQYGFNCWFLFVFIGLIIMCNFVNNSELQKNIIIWIFEEYNYLLYKC